MVLKGRPEAGRDSPTEITLLSVAQFPRFSRVTKAAHAHLSAETLDLLWFLPLQFPGDVSAEKSVRIV